MCVYVRMYVCVVLIISVCEVCNLHIDIGSDAVCWYAIEQRLFRQTGRPSNSLVLNANRTCWHTRPATSRVLFVRLSLRLINSPSCTAVNREQLKRHGDIYIWKDILCWNATERLRRWESWTDAMPEIVPTTFEVAQLGAPTDVSELRDTQVAATVQKVQTAGHEYLYGYKRESSHR